MEERVILVDAQNRELGTMEKFEAHRKGLLHRAFSIFIFRESGEMLIHKRAEGKYHCGGLWTNACCSHPRPEERLEEALTRKLNQEMGFETHLSKAFDFTYRAELNNGLVEYEFDEVFVGHYGDDIRPNPNEVEDWRYVDIENLRSEILRAPDSFTPWFRMLFDPVTRFYARSMRA